MLLLHVVKLIMLTDQRTRPSRDALAIVSYHLDVPSNVMVNTQKPANASDVT